MKQRKPMKPIPLYIAVDNGTTARCGALGLKDNCPVGCHFIAAFFKRKFAAQAADQWGDAHVVPIEIRERPKPRRAEGKGRGK